MKVFGIGLNKTGTTTLGHCARELGLRRKSCDRDLLQEIVLAGDFSGVARAVAEYDFFDDWPWPLIYRYVDQMFPGSKFVLTTRADAETWLRSLKKHSMRSSPIRHCRKLAYGFNYPHGHEDAHLQFYEDHNRDVRAYFEGRPADLLEVCWENSAGWGDLCSFLEKEVPETPFPHANASGRMKLNRRLALINGILARIQAPIR